MDKLAKCICLATEAHSGQLDKAGKPYILHPLAVMAKMDTENEMCLAVLHDVLEDTTLTHEDIKLVLADYGDYGTADKLLYLTKKPGEKYYDYIKRIKDTRNPTVIKVKLADIAHNSSEERLNCLDADEAEYLRNKYKKALGILKRE